MSILSRALREVRAPISYQQVWGAGKDWGPAAESGETVNSRTAMQLIAVWACVRLIANAVATLPFRQVVTVGDTSFSPSDQPAWMSAPRPRDPSTTMVEHLTQVMLSLLLDGNAYIAVLPDVAEPSELIVLDPTIVQPVDAGGGRTEYLLRSSASAARRLGPESLLHIPLTRQPGTLRGLSPVDAARQGIGLGLAADRFGSRFFGAGTVLSGVIQTKVPMNQIQADALKAKWSAKHAGVSRAWEPAVLDNGAEWKPLGITPEQGQFLETRKFQVEEVARLFAVPPAMIGLTTPGAVSYASSEMQMLAFLQHTLTPYLVRLEAAYSPLVSVPSRITATGARTKVEFDQNALLRADFKTRMEAYSAAIQNGSMTRAEVRRKENQPPIAGLDEPLVPVNLAGSTDAGIRAKVESLAKLVQFGFEPAAAASAVGLPPIAHTGLVPKTVQPPAAGDLP